jgi:chorismate mutase
VLVGALCAHLGSWPSAEARAQEQQAADVALQKVVLFNAGVGYFEHRGKVSGDARVDLQFNVDDINDLLKSMVLQDLGGGQVSTVTYGSRDPITKTLKTFAIDLTDNPTLADLLRQIRGEQVEIEAPNKIVGKIVGVEKRKKLIGDGEQEAVEVEILNLLTSSGFKSINLEQVGSIRLVSDKLNQELQQALTLLATSHATDKKTVTLNFAGAGERPVRVGYIQATPIWKTSYRLVLKDDAAPFLQGWAIVENTTEQDWDNVSLSLMSGRPISFRMDLYQPLYVTRPLVVPELYASLMPRVYGQDLAEKEELFRRAGVAGNAPTAPPGLAAGAAAADRSLMGRPAEKRAGVALGGARFYAEPQNAAGEGLSLQDGVRSLARAEDVGELFQYQIETPVTLQRQRSAMLPIVNSDVKGEKVSIYNAAVQAKHPLNGLRLTNSTELHLMQGPITVFDGGAYAGDARIEDLPPKSERLISYALDLDTEVAPTSKSHPEQLLSVRIAKGTLYSSRKFLRTTTYTVKNSGGKPKKVLVEYPHTADWKLVSPKEPAEKTRDLYRFAVSAQPGKPEALTVEEEMVQSQSVVLSNIDDNMILFYLNASVVSDKVKDALKQLLSRKQKLAQLAAERQRLQQQIAVIGEEQARIRKNMEQLDRNTELYNRYVKKFAEQEDLNDKLRTEIERLNLEEAKQRKELDAYLAGLDVT